jgi:hypothetical protein
MTTMEIDAAARVKTLIALTEELSAIFDRENDALKSRRPRDISPLQADKARLAAAYAQSIRDVAADRSVVAGVGEALMEKLRELTVAFERRAAEQRALLSGAAAAAEGVLKAVAGAVGADNAGPAYAPREQAQVAAAAISVDERA